MTIQPEQVSAWCNGEWFPSIPLQSVCSACFDSRRAGPGILFFALQGTQADGHVYLPQVAAAGGYAVVRRDVPVSALPADGFFLRVDEPLTALGDLARAYRCGLSARVVGVTGSVGKTSIKEITANMLSRLGPTVRTAGNFNNEIGLPLSVLSVGAEDRYAVLEAGVGRPGDMAYLQRILKPDAAIVSRIGPVHLQFFESVRAIAEEKALLLEELPAEGVAVLDMDDEFFPLLAERSSAPVVRCSMAAAAADYLGRLEADGSLVVVEQGGAGMRLPVPPPGGYMAENVLKAAALARRLGASWEDIAAALKEDCHVGYRWHVEEWEGKTLINDAYNANPVSMERALAAFAAMEVPGRKFAALGPMLSLGAGEAAFHYALGRTVAALDLAGVAVVPAGHEAAAEALRQGLMDGQYPAGRVIIKDYAMVADWLAGRLQPGDALLLKASRDVQLEKVAALLKDLV